MAKNLFSKIVSWLGLFFFILAAYMLYHQLSKYSLEDIQKSLLSIPTKNVLLACLSSIVGYVALSSYDFLALRYIKKKVAVWKWIFAGFIGFSVSNSAGHALISGGAIRYRLYSRWGLSAMEIIKMVTFSGFTYLVACFFLVIVGYVMTPDHAFGAGSVSKTTTDVVALFSAIGLAIYFAMSFLWKKRIQFKKVKLLMPRPRMALAQMLLGSLDIVMAAFVLYFSLIPFVDIQFNVFIGVFLVAQVLGVFSQVPGGLGVFEGLFMYILPGEENKAYLFGALIAYRIIYYLLPLALSSIVLIFYEASLARTKRLEDKQQKML